MVNKPAIRKPSGLLKAYSRVQDQLKLDEVGKGRPLIFRAGYPVAVQHDDFLKINFLVNEATGHIIGVVDWAAAIIAPFNFCTIRTILF